MKYRAAMFDLDGTLLDTIDDLADCMNTVLAEYGFEQVSAERYKLMVGDGLETWIRRAVACSANASLPDTKMFVTRYRELYAGRWADKTRPYDGITEMLAALVKAGLKLTVLSNKPDGPTRKMVDHFLGEFPFELVCGAMDNVPLKPDPSAAIDIASRIAVPLPEILYVGDTDTDMQTATSAGMYAVGAAWGFRTPKELADNGAATIIDHPMELLELL